MITSTTTTKVKGTGTLHYDDNDKLLFNSNDAIHVFDTSEFVIPANEYEATFLMTNFIKTHQTIGKCGEVFTFFQHVEYINCYSFSSRIRPLPMPSVQMTRIVPA
jgi:ATP P2X receptor